jgi:hypothetical protein
MNTPMAPLETMESPSVFYAQAGPTYSLALLGVDDFISQPGLRSLRTYWEATAAGTSWEIAFASAFGITTTQFYNRFDATVPLFVPPARFECNN